MALTSPLLLLTWRASCFHVFHAAPPDHVEIPKMAITMVDAQADIVIAVQGGDQSASLMPILRLPEAFMTGPTFLVAGRKEVTIRRAPAQPPPPKHTYIVFFIKVAVILAVALALLLAYSALQEGIQRVTGIRIQHVSCLIFMCLSVLTDLSTKAAAVSHGHFAFDPAVCVVIVETCKLVVSVFLFGMTLADPKERSKVMLPTGWDILILAVPGFVYTCNNILVFKAIENVPISTFAVLRETRIIWNALIWMAVFKVRLGLMRWLAIIGVLVGCSANQVPAMLRMEFSWGFMWALLLAFTNAAGGVACEFAMKYKASMDINLQNAILYTSCAGLALVYLAVFQTSTLHSPSAFFAGFAPECLQIIVLQVITGLTVSRILKHVESVTKSMVAAFCGPVIICLGAFALHTRLHVNEIIAALVVVASCVAFLRQGPLAALAPPAEAAGKEPVLNKEPIKGKPA